MLIGSLVADFCTRLDSANAPYCIGGSVASGVWGEPRQTNDVNIEVWLSNQNIDQFLLVLANDYLVSETEARDALTSEEEFPSVQVLHIQEGFKFDCFISRDTPVDREAMKRTVTVDIDGHPI